MSEPNAIDIFDVWLRMLAYSGKTEEQVEQYKSVFRKDVAVLPIPYVEDIIVTAGFTAPILFCQTLFIHAWFSRLS